MVRLGPRLRPLFPYLKPAYSRGTRALAPVSMALGRVAGGRVPRGVAATAEDAVTSGGRMWVVREPEVIQRPLPVGSPERVATMAQARSDLVARVPLVELPGGRVMEPHAAVVTADGRLVDELCFYFGTSHPREHPVFLHPFGPQIQRVDGSVGVLSSRGDSNYYHFLHDCLPRLFVLEQCPEVGPPDRWLTPVATSFQRQLLDLAGVPEAQRLDQALVPHLQAERLVVPGLPSTKVQNPPWVSRELRARFCPDATRVPGRHVYLTRGTSRNNRAVLNEDAVVALLEARGFTCLDPGAMTVADQIRWFSEADVIVAPHGAALANLAFTSPGATVLELFGAYVDPCYWRMAAGIEGLTYRYLADANVSSSTNIWSFLVQDIEVDLDRLARAVDALLPDAA
jgi:capsular polysaccharide biosynthesis protein